MSIYIMILNTLIKEGRSERWEFHKTRCMFKGQQIHYANASRLKEHDHCPCNVQPAVPGGGTGVDLSIRLSIHSSNIIDITMCKVLGARVKKTSKQFFFQGAHRLEGETYILILQCQVECAIDTASWLSTAFRARLPVFESQSLVNHVTLKGSYLISLSSISSSAKWGCLSW